MLPDKLDELANLNNRMDVALKKQASRADTLDQALADALNAIHALNREIGDYRKRIAELDAERETARESRARLVAYIRQSALPGAFKRALREMSKALHAEEANHAT